jgi:hypothetical protein
MAATLLASYGLPAQQASEIINIQEPVDEDIYLAGRSINILSAVTGDAVLAGQRVTVAQSVTEDLIAVGERIILRAKIGDDVRAAGRIINIDAEVGDDVILAAETIALGPNATISGRTWAAARSIDVAGQLGAELRAAAQEVTIGGQITGNVYLIAENIEVLPGAMITGDFSYRSSTEANIASGANISGKVIRLEMELPEEPDAPIFLIVSGFFLTLLLSVSVMSWLFSRLIVDAGTSITQEGFKSIGLGVVLFLLTPPIILILVVTVIGIPLGLALLALYFIILFLGLVVGINFIGDLFLKLIGKREDGGNGWRLLGIALAIILIMVTQLIPLLGGLAFIILFLLGLGAAAMQLFKRYRVEYR